jgi:type II secretory pathway pseudopilin PulG
VLLIAGILAGLALLTLAPDDPGARAQRALDRLSGALSAMCDQAVLRARPQGVRFHATGYDFWVLQSSGWQRRTGDGPPRPARWPDGLDARVEIDRIDPSRGRAPRAAPQLWCTGVEPPPILSVALGRGGDRRRLDWPG